MHPPRPPSALSPQASGGQQSSCQAAAAATQNVVSHGFRGASSGGGGAGDTNAGKRGALGGVGVGASAGCGGVVGASAGYGGAVNDKKFGKPSKPWIQLYKEQVGQLLDLTAKGCVYSCVVCVYTRVYTRAWLYVYSCVVCVYTRAWFVQSEALHKRKPVRLLLPWRH